MLAANTAEEIHELVNAREDGEGEIQMINRKTGLIEGELSADTPLDTARYRYRTARIVILSDSVEVSGDSLSFDEVRKLLLLVKSAQRKHRRVIVGQAEEGNETSFDIVAKSDGSLTVGCQVFSAAEVSYVAKNLPK